jgi:hypothetical protein
MPRLAIWSRFTRAPKDQASLSGADPGYCATDLNGSSGFRTAAQGAEVSVHLATLPADGPSGML